MPKERDWKKAQPHKADDGTIASREYAENNKDKVEWVTAKPTKKATKKPKK